MYTFITQKQRRNWCTFGLCALALLPISAQTDTAVYNVPEPWRIPAVCEPKNHAAVEAVVLHTNYAKVTLRFTGSALDASTPVRYKEIGAAGAGTSITAQAGQTMSLNLPLQKQYQLVTMDDCNAEVSLGEFSTKPSSMAGSRISPRRKTNPSLCSCAAAIFGW